MKLRLTILCIFRLSILSLASGIEVTVVAGTENQNFTEGPFWEYENEALLYVDKDFFEVHRLEISTGNHQVITFNQMPTFVIPTKGFDRRFIINQGTNLVYLLWPYDYKGGYYAQCLIATVDHYCQGHNFNDARADAYGRIWSGTYPKPDLKGNYPPNQASLYRINTRTAGKSGVTAALRPISFSNDLTWTRDSRRFYFTEADLGCIFSYNYDLVRGAICCGQAVFCFCDYNITGEPDGLTIDWNDDLWITALGAGLVLNFSPKTKQLIRTVKLPVKYVTDVEFGGPRLDILFVTTRNVGDPSEPLAGSIFQVTGLNVFGIRSNYAVMNSDCTPEFFN